MNEGFWCQLCINAKLSRHIVAAKRQKILMYIKGVKIKQGFRIFLQILGWFLLYVYLYSQVSIIYTVAVPSNFLYGATVTNSRNFLGFLN